jgi:hypothetical protein
MMSDTILLVEECCRPVAASGKVGKRLGVRLQDDGLSTAPVQLQVGTYQGSQRSRSQRVAQRWNEGSKVCRAMSLPGGTKALDQFANPDFFRRSQAGVGGTVHHRPSSADWSRTDAF